MTYKITWNEVNLGHMIVETEEEAQEFIEELNMDDPRFTWEKSIYDIDYVEIESSEESTDEDTDEDTQADLLTLTFSKTEFKWAREWSDDKWNNFKRFVYNSESIYEIVKDDLLKQLMDDFIDEKKREEGEDTDEEEDE